MGAIGIFVHGRHVGTVDWERLVWGDPENNKLGSLTRLVLEILERGPENVKTVVFGSGASEKEGIVEAQRMKNFLLDHISELDAFPIICNHIKFQGEAFSKLLALIRNIYCDTISRNTAQEVEHAITFFADAGCTEIYQISCRSHLPRCVAERMKAKIPSGQYWYAVSDDMTYPGSRAEDIVVLEPPHRSDDPMLGSEVQMLHVIRKLFELSPEDRLECLKFLDEEINAKRGEQLT